MRVGVVTIAALAAQLMLLTQPAGVDAATALTCTFNIQSKMASTLVNPPTETEDPTANKDKKNGTSAGSSSSTGDSGTDGSSNSNTDAGSTDIATAAPATTAPATPDPQVNPPSPATTAPTSGSMGNTGGAGETPAPTPTKKTRRFLQATDNNGTNAGDNTPAPTDAVTPVPTAGGDTNGTTSSNTTTSAADSFTCDEAFYSKWDENKLKCGGVGIDVAKAVAASQCVIYSGTLGVIPGTSCVSICSFPACVGDEWVYGGENGMASDVYKTVGIGNFLPDALSSGLSKRTSGAAVVVGNTTFISSNQCPYKSEVDFSSCACSKLSANGAKSDETIKKEREIEKALGIVPEDKTTNAGSVLAPTTSSVAGVTVFVSGVAAIASSVASGAGAASSSVAAAGASAAVVTIEICQFGVLLNQLQLDGKSAALSLFGKQMAPSTFTFLPFGKLEDPAKSSKGRRLATSPTETTGIAQYSRTLGIREDMLFVVTLAGVIVVMAGVVALFGIAYFISGLFMDRDEFMNKFFDKMIGVQVLIAILSQYTIGVTGTYQIYYSFSIDKPTEAKCILAIAALITLALGIMLYGYIVIRKHEDDIRDVGTFTHVNKKVCLRYGPLYDEYKYKNRFFFAPKMMLALVSGVATGYVGFQPKYQVSIILAVHVFFFFYLEVQSPHHSRFVQTTTSFVTIMKIATLALTFFLISATAGVPSELQNAISLAIVSLNLFVLFLLMVRSLYAFWKKYQLQRDAKYEDVDQSAAQQYFKEETPQRRAGVPQDQNPYLQAGNPSDISESDEIRLRSGTHMQQQQQRYGGGGRDSYDDPRSRYDPSRSNGAQHYIANPRDQHQRGRNDVVEL